MASRRVEANILAYPTLGFVLQGRPFEPLVVQIVHESDFLEDGDVNNNRDHRRLVENVTMAYFKQDLASHWKNCNELSIVMELYQLRGDSVFSSALLRRCKIRPRRLSDPAARHLIIFLY